MKTLLILIGLATSCFLSGCAHDSNGKTPSKPDNAAVAGQSATFTVTNTGTPPLYYQWQFNGTNTMVVTVTNLQGAAFSVVTSTGTAPLTYQWYFSTNIQSETIQPVTKK